MVESPLSTTFRGKSCGSGSNEKFFDAQEEDPRPDPVSSSRERFELRKVHSDGAIGSTQNPNFVEEKFPKEIFRVNGEMRDESLVYDPFLTKFWSKMASECMENAGKFWILGFSKLGFRV